MPKTLLLLPLLAIAAPGCHDRVIAIAAPVADNPGLMTVTGSAVLEVSPDCADLTMTVSVDNPRPAVATEDVNRKEQAVIAALVGQGVLPNDMKLSLVSLEPIYMEHLYPMKVSTYRAQITVTATTRDFAKISVMMEAATDAGASQLGSAFRRSDLPALKKKVRDMALAAAKDKAKQTATALGIELGRVVTVSENTGGSMWNSGYFPQTANMVERTNQQAGPAIGGTMQSLSLDVSVGYQLSGPTKG